MKTMEILKVTSSRRSFDQLLGQLSTLANLTDLDSKIEEISIWTDGSGIPVLMLCLKYREALEGLSTDGTLLADFLRKYGFVSHERWLEGRF